MQLKRPKYMNGGQRRTFVKSGDQQQVCLLTMCINGLKLLDLILFANDVFNVFSPFKIHILRCRLIRSQHLKIYCWQQQPHFWMLKRIVTVNSFLKIWALICLCWMIRQGLLTQTLPTTKHHSMFAM